MSSLCDTFSSTGGCFLVGSASYNLIIKKVTLEQNHAGLSDTDTVTPEGATLPS
jgi:hypothetical protein